MRHGHGYGPQFTSEATTPVAWKASSNTFTLGAHRHLGRARLAALAGLTAPGVSPQLLSSAQSLQAVILFEQLVVWRVPTPVPPTEHGFKYRAVYAKDGVRIVGFDNERGKGDHCHLDGQEMPYTFTGVGPLVEDFIAAVAARRTT